MLPSNIELLHHILDEITFVYENTKATNKHAFINDAVLSRAVIGSLEIIWEACSKLDPDFKSLYPHVEWRKIFNTRNRLIHDYLGVD